MANPHIPHTPLAYCRQTFDVSPRLRFDSVPAEAVDKSCDIAFLLLNTAVLHKTFTIARRYTAMDIPSSPVLPILPNLTIRINTHIGQWDRR